MNWRTDWLFQLVVRDVEQIWQRALKESAQSPDSIPPEYILLYQYADVSVQPDDEISSVVSGRPILSASFVTPIIKQWKFDKSGVHIYKESSSNAHEEHLIRGMFYQAGVFNFGLTSDRKLLYTTYTLGPRYGRGEVFKVKGQGSGASLQRHEDFINRVS